MKKIIIISFLLAITLQAIAQKEFKLAKTSGKLVIKNISNLTVEGYDGKEIIISTPDKEAKTNPRTEGLTALGNSGFDNTELGINITEKNQTAEMSLINKFEGTKVSVKIPYSIALSLITNNNNPNQTITLINLKSEVDVSSVYENIKISNLAGPLNIKTLGNIEGSLASAFKGPIYLASVYGFIDLAIPPTAKANLTVNTTYQTLYASKDLKLELTENKSKDAINTSTTTNDVNTVSHNSYVQPYTYETSVNGTLNGGGEKIVLKSTFGKIYLRNNQTK